MRCEVIQNTFGKTNKFPSHGVFETKNSAREYIRELGTIKKISNDCFSVIRNGTKRAIIFTIENV